MTERHPPMAPERLEAFESQRGDDFLNGYAKAIATEARATKCEHLRFQDALLVLTFERWERGILNTDERDRLLRRLYT